MGKPYSDLEKRALAILANGGNPASSNDQAVAKYWNWKVNPSHASHKLPTTSIRIANRKKDFVNIKIFSANIGAENYAKVPISKRSSEALGAVSGGKEACAYITIGASDDNKKALKLKSFRPAYVYWRTGEAQTSTGRTSRITGRPYKSYYTAQDQGYVVPFGKSGDNSEATSQKHIRAKLEAYNLVTFTPEKYRE